MDRLQAELAHKGKQEPFDHLMVYLAAAPGRACVRQIKHFVFIA